MTDILASPFTADPILDGLLRALPSGFRAFETPDNTASISQIRDFVASSAPGMTRFVLAIGAGSRSGIATADWDRDVTVPLRRAFGLATGAARLFRTTGEGAIVFVLPSAALLPIGRSFAGLVLLRSVLGLAEALRAELSSTGVRVGVVFFDSAVDRLADLASRVVRRLDDGAMYDLSPMLTQDWIEAYFTTILKEVDLASAGAPLPDIGPMAAVYDLNSIGARPTGAPHRP